jgi:hypothetical protein
MTPVTNMKSCSSSYSKSKFFRRFKHITPGMSIQEALHVESTSELSLRLPSPTCRPVSLVHELQESSEDMEISCIAADQRLRQPLVCEVGGIDTAIQQEATTPRGSGDSGSMLTVNVSAITAWSRSSHQVSLGPVALSVDFIAFLPAMAHVPGAAEVSLAGTIPI